jgi:hypothetical protein
MIPDRRNKDSREPTMKNEHEAPMNSNKKKEKIKRMPSEILAEKDSLKDDVSGYEFQEIADLESWSSLEGDNYMSVNNMSHKDVSFGYQSKTQALDEILKGNDRKTVNFVGENIETMVVGEKNAHRGILTKKRLTLDPDRPPLVSFSQFLMRSLTKECQMRTRRRFCVMTNLQSSLEPRGLLSEKIIRITSPLILTFHEK